MNTKLIFAYIFFSFANPTIAQRHDYTWLMGYSENLPEQHFGGSRMDFNKEPREVSYFNLPEKFSFLNPCVMSDENGKLLFYSNGCKIINSEHLLMENGQDINPGLVHDNFCEKDFYDYDDMQGMVSVPFPSHPGHYILFHGAREGAMNLPIFPTSKYYFSEIDMTANDGLGRMILKNQLLFGPDSVDLMVTAVRHGNGRDWWVITGRRFSNVFYLYSVTPGGVDGPFTLDQNNTWINGHYGSRSAVFSPDGSKFIRTTEGPNATLTLFKFDRCTGSLHDPVQITLPLPDSLLSSPWPAFSPNSRYLYIQNRRSNLWQFDTWANDISQSGILVGKYDGYRDSSDNLYFPTTFHSMNLAPDGKIYMATGTTTIYMHIIHSPDLPGLQCDFRQHDLKMPTNIAFFVPSFPNYRLFDLPNSPCDTLGISATVDEPHEFGVSLVPNPANNESYLRVQGYVGQVQIRVLNLLGQLIYEARVSDGDTQTELPVHLWTPGSYIVWIGGEGQGSQSLKLVVER